MQAGVLINRLNEGNLTVIPAFGTLINAGHGKVLGVYRGNGGGGGEETP